MKSEKTSHQILGIFGEMLVAKKAICPDCNRKRTLKRLPNNFKCADIICDFCGMLAQVKSMNVKDITVPPTSVLGAAWGPQKERLRDGIRFHLYLVLKNEKKVSIFFLSKENQLRNIFVPRKPLSQKARRAGWQGFKYNLDGVESKLQRIL